MPRRRPSSPLYCRRCVLHSGKTRHDAALGLRIDRDIHRARIYGERRDSVQVTCPEGHEFRSVHPDALARSRARDERANVKLAMERAE
jgi:hypothetical protein